MSSEPDVVYSSRSGRDLHVDVYRPDGRSRRTAVLVSHGGGWRVGDRTMVRPRCEALAALGFTAVAVEYRLLGEAPWPAALHDVKAAVSWARREAGGLGIDPDKIVLQGHSAGAHLSLVAAGSVGASDIEADPEAEADDRPVAAVVAYYPPVSLTVDIPMPEQSGPPGPGRGAPRGRPCDDGRGPAGMLLGPEATEEAARAASPIERVSADFPPTLLFHGTSDRMLHPASSLHLYEKLQAAGVPAELHLVAGAEHEFDTTPSLGEVCAVTTASFLDRYVIAPEEFAAEVARTNPLAAGRPSGDTGPARSTAGVP
jgi:acetyl esterase/lipase